MHISNGLRRFWHEKRFLKYSVRIQNKKIEAKEIKKFLPYLNSQNRDWAEYSRVNSSILTWIPII